VSLPSAGKVTGRPRTGYVPERFPGGLPFSGREYLLHLARVHGLRGQEGPRRVEQWLERLGAAGYADQSLRSMSKGMGQGRALELRRDRPRRDPGGPGAPGGPADRTGHHPAGNRQRGGRHRPGTGHRRGAGDLRRRRGGESAVTALLRYQTAILLRSHRWVLPLIGYALLIAVGAAGSTSLAETLDWSGAMLVPVVAFLTRAMLTAESPTG
jgi:hypothetical protein